MDFLTSHVLTWVSYGAALWWFIGVGGLVVTSLGALLQPWIQARRAKNADLHPISAILPIKLVNPGFEAAQASIFAQNYPSYEITFSAAETTSPALTSVDALRQAYPHVASRVLQSHVDIAVSPKLNTLATPLTAASNDVILTKDSNIVFAPDMMEAMARNLAPGVGLVCCVPVAVNAEGFAGHVEATLINAHARLLLTASALGMGFGVGKAMLFRRSDLARSGGVEAVAYTIAEDTAISRGLAAQGLKTVFAHRTAQQEIGRRTWSDIYARQLRWGVIRRAHEPIACRLEPLTFAVPTAFAGALAAPAFDINALIAFAVTLGGWFCGELALARAKGWEIAPNAPVAFLGREVLALSAWLRSWTTDRVIWANGHFNVFTGLRSSARASAPSTLALRRQSVKSG